MEKFKANPYNYSNKLISEKESLILCNHLILMILKLIIYLYIKLLLYINHIVIW